MDQATLQTVTDSTKKNMLLQQSTSNLTEKYPLKQDITVIKSQSTKPKYKLQVPKQSSSKEKIVEYNPTPIKELQEQKKKTKFDEYDPATNYSVFGSNTTVKRKSVSDKGDQDVKTKRTRHESTEQIEAKFSDEEEEDIKAPEFSDLDDSGDERKSKSKDTNGSTSIIVKKNQNHKHTNDTDGFEVFEKAGRRCSKGIDIVPVEDILGVKHMEHTDKEKSSVSKDNGKMSVKSSKKDLTKNDTQEENNSLHDKENVLKKGSEKNIFEEFLKSDKLKAVTKKVVESGETNGASAVDENMPSEKLNTSSGKHRHSSSKHKHSSGERHRRHYSGDKDKKRTHSSHSTEKHGSSSIRKRSSGEKDHKHSSRHKHSKKEKESKSNDQKQSQVQNNAVPGDLPKKHTSTDKSQHKHSEHRHRHSSSSSSHHKYHRHKDKHSRRHSISDKHKSDKKKSDSPGVVLKRQVSHVELFGEESDSEGSAKVEVYLVLYFFLHFHFSI